MRKGLYLFVVFAFLTFRGAGQCLAPQLALEGLKRIIQETNVVDQYAPLKKWRKDWEKCEFPRDSNYSDGLFQLSLVYYYNGELDSALVLTQFIVDLNNKPSKSLRPTDVSKAYYRLGAFNYMAGRTDRALSFLNKSIEKGKATNAANWVAESYAHLAHVYYIGGDYHKAISLIEEGIIYAERAKNNIATAKLFSVLSDNQKALGRLEIALANQLRAIERIKREPTQKVALAIYYGRLGEIYEVKGEHQQAISSYKKGFELAKKLRYHDIPDFAVRLGMTYYSQKKYSDAIPYFELAVEQYKKPVGRARAYNNLGAAYWQLGLFEKAFDNYQKGIEQLPISFSASSFEKNPPAKAMQQIFQKEYLLTLIQDKADTWFDYYKWTPNRLYLANALQTYAVADTMVDYMRFEHSGDISKLFWRHKTRRIYEQAIAVCFLAGMEESAFHFLEKAKAVLLTDQLNELGAAHLLSEADRVKEKEIRARVSELQSKLELTVESEISSVRSELFIAQEQLETFIKSLEKSNPQYYAYKYDNKVPSIEDVRTKVLKSNQTLLSFFVGDSALYGMAIDQKKAVFKKLDLKEYHRQTNAFQRLIGDRNMQNSNFREYLSVSAALYKLLIEPFDIPEGSRVIVSPDGEFLPFGALSKSDEKPDFLVNYYAFSYAYSAGVLGKTQRKKDSRWLDGSFMGMAPVQFATGMNQATLTGSDKVLSNISRHFFWPHVTTGSEASRSSFVRSASDYRIVQLFTHASADSAGSIPTLYFADSTLRLNELTLARRSLTELLVLSACQTGIGKNQRGEGVFSLARGFAAQGIPSVLTTLWSVENEPVYGITEEFYNQIGDGLPLDVALQKAQKQWLNAASQSGQLPYAWSGMVIVGNTEPVVTSGRYRLGYLLILLLLISVGFYVIRRINS